MFWYINKLSHNQVQSPLINMFCLKKTILSSRLLKKEIHDKKCIIFHCIFLSITICINSKLIDVQI